MDFENLAQMGLKHLTKLEADNREMKDRNEHDYSLLHSLLKAGNENQLHSNFIYSMINPHGLHYQGRTYLEAFLSCIPETIHKDFDIEKTRVIKEENYIDLMITDDINFLIIENKINAIDQRYQITRYIQKIKQDYLDDSLVTGQIAVIYLSAKKRFPSQKSESLIGFHFSPDQTETDYQELIWHGFDGNPPKELSALKLPEGFQVSYFHFRYFPHLENWVRECIKQSENKPDIRYAFEEYQKILDRLKPNNKWKKVMDFDEYVIRQTTSQQAELYKLMINSQSALHKYVAKRLYQDLSDIFGEDAFNNLDRRYAKITEKSICKWLTKKGHSKNWKDIGFIYRDYLFVFGVINSYFIPIQEQIDSTKRLLGKPTRPVLLKQKDGKGLTDFIEAVTKIKNKIDHK
jgi:hypothetical protein